MRTLIAMLVLLGSTAAHADEPAVERPAWMWTVGPMVRATGTDSSSDDELARLDEYGWDTQPAALWGLRGDLAYLHAPIVDLGIAWAWATGEHANGPAFDDPDTIKGSTLEAGVFARVHWVKPSSPVAAEPRVELGLARSTATLRDVDSHRVGYYTKVGLDFRLGARKAGAMFSVDYTSVHAGDAMLELPTGGLTFSLSFYWRQW